MESSFAGRDLSRERKRDREKGRMPSFFSLLRRWDVEEWCPELDSENRRAHTDDSADISKRRMRLFTALPGANIYRYRGPLRISQSNENIFSQYD